MTDIKKERLRELMALLRDDIREHEAKYAGQFTENIYDSSLIEQNKQVDNILKLLLGSQFKQPISELKLIEKYHYPTVTDKEVHDAAMRNL